MGKRASSLKRSCSLARVSAPAPKRQMILDQFSETTKVVEDVEIK